MRCSGPFSAARWPFGRYSFRGLLAKLEPQVLYLPEFDGRWIVELWYTVPDRETAEPCRLREYRRVEALVSPEALDAVVYALLDSVLAHEVPEGMLVLGEVYLDAHPEVR